MTSQQDTELEKLITEHFYQPHADSDHETCASLYLINPDDNKKVYVYNASPEQKDAYIKQACDCGVEDAVNAAIQALTSWKDKEVTKTDVRTLETVCMLLNGDDNQLEVVRNYARNKLKMYNERKKSLQSQGGKMVQIKESKGE